MTSPCYLVLNDEMDEDPNPELWARARRKLTVNERRVYLFLRWAAVRGGYPGRDGTIDRSRIGHYLGGKEAARNWEGGGAPLSKAAVERALRALEQKGLIGLDDDDLS